MTIIKCREISIWFPRVCTKVSHGQDRRRSWVVPNGYDRGICPVFAISTAAGGARAFVSA